MPLDLEEKSKFIKPIGEIIDTSNDLWNKQYLPE